MDNQWKWCVLYPKLVWEIWSEFKHNAKYHNLNIIILFYFWQSLSVNPYPSLNIFFFFVLQHMWISEYIFSNPTEKVYPKPFESLHPFQKLQQEFTFMFSKDVRLHRFTHLTSRLIFIFPASHSLTQQMDLAHVSSCDQSVERWSHDPQVVIYGRRF